MEIIRKNNLIKKILIPFIALAIFLMPISPSLKINNGHLATKITVNRAYAESIETATKEIGETSASFKIILLNTINLSVYNTPYNVIITLYQGKSDGTTEKNYIETQNFPFEVNTERQEFDAVFKKLNPGTSYYFTATVYHTISGDSSIKIRDFDTTGNGGSGLSTQKDASELVNIDNQELNLECTIWDGWEGIGGCIANLFYMVWQVSEWIANLAGGFLDFFVYYSTNSSSYVSGFITEGWGAIRDIANIFFIVALLYVAIKTILSLGGQDTKKLIGYIVIMALLINFSLFFTRVIVDGSNILAKVFYNNITPKNKDGKVITGDEGEKSITVGLVDKFNPASLVTNSVYQSEGMTLGKFIFIVLLLTAITLSMAYMFFTVAIVFVSRTVMLWISMIFSPIAFASYTLPFNIPGMGHKDWWDQLLKNAFLAPIFVFFLYIIVMFTNFLKEITYDPTNDSFLGSLMHIVIPFIILFMLLMKAKEMAVKLSGEMGKAITKGATMLGGVALGAAAGSAAFAMRGTLGRVGNALGNAEWTKKTGKFGRGMQNIGHSLGKGSFDVRGIKVAGKSLASTGIPVGTTSGTGGYEKIRADKIEKRQKRAKELEVGENSGMKQELNKTEADLQGLLVTNAKEIEDIDKLIDKKKQEAADAERKMKGLPPGQEHEDAQAALRAANDEVQNAKDRKKNFREGRAHTDLDGTVHDYETSAVLKDKNGNTIHKKDANGNIELDANGRPIAMGIDVLEKQQKTQAQGIKTENVIRRTKYAKAKGHWYNGKGSREAAHKIIMETKLDSGTKT
ncbi:MAG TPA: hypothetical protein PKZ36_01245 [Candidatus Paceibacterota bacterium]|nr:hypothetical protein [Candidatus Paceibacterota bacterium]HPT18015.1 hypothetical protein [Candidatus Paceibacterota bacterium]